MHNTYGCVCVCVFYSFHSCLHLFDTSGCFHGNAGMYPITRCANHSWRWNMSVCLCTCVCVCVIKDSRKRELKINSLCDSHDSIKLYNYTMSSKTSSILSVPLLHLVCSSILSVPSSILSYIMQCDTNVKLEYSPRSEVRG